MGRAYTWKRHTVQALVFVNLQLGASVRMTTAKDDPVQGMPAPLLAA